MASLWLGSGSVGRRSKNVSEELRNVVICGTFGPRTVWAQGGGVRPRFWGRRKTAGGPEGRPVLAAYLGQQSKLFLRSVKGTAYKRGLIVGGLSGFPGLFSRPRSGGVGCCFLVAAWLPVGAPVCCRLGGLLWGCSGTALVCPGPALDCSGCSGAALSCPGSA